ncbi:hypothetical protein Acr_20g0011530 [Actinidia rufa]|uniref:Uncharacterized protein n=1 Tax=Actinidia rufa TaxID=165716 RepID=A0A7J0GF00_9ERIC|nr:hypothetical protein Acr_20g0011530 [Actinidia rufa]
MLKVQGEVATMVASGTENAIPLAIVNDERVVIPNAAGNPHPGNLADRNFTYKVDPGIADSILSPSKEQQPRSTVDAECLVQGETSPLAQ